MARDRQGDDRRFDLHEAFMGKEEELAAALRTGRRNAGHAGVQGEGTETHWHEVLGQTLPARYQAMRAFVVDSRGGQSEQIDLAIVDRHFSPLFWDWGGHCYVPAESVYCAFEVKPEINREYILYAGKKIASVRGLYRTSASFGWAMGTMPARELPSILGGFLGGSSGWSPAFGDPFRQALADLPPGGEIDLGCVLNEGSFELPIGAGINGTVVSPAQTALVSFTLAMLKRLQGIGSAPAIDYDAYAHWVGSQSGPGSM